MYPQPETIQALALTAEQLELFKTPFSKMTKEGAVAAFALGDRVANYEWEENRKRKAEEEARSEEEKIIQLQEDMKNFNNTQPRKFY